MTRRETPRVVTVAWVEKSRVGLRSHLSCGHMRVLTDWRPERDKMEHDLMIHTMLGYDLSEGTDMEPDPRGAVSMGGAPPRGHGIGDWVQCAQCPPDVFDDMAMFEDLRGKL